VYNKTLISCDHFQTFSFIRFLEAFIWGGRYYFDRKKGCWCQQFKVKGYVEGGWFYPNMFESISYKIFWPYGQKNWENPPTVDAISLHHYLNLIRI